MMNGEILLKQYVTLLYYEVACLTRFAEVYFEKNKYGARILSMKRLDYNKK